MIFNKQETCDWAPKTDRFQIIFRAGRYLVTRAHLVFFQLTEKHLIEKFNGDKEERRKLNSKKEGMTIGHPFNHCESKITIDGQSNHNGGV